MSDLVQVAEHVLWVIFEEEVTQLGVLRHRLPCGRRHYWLGTRDTRIHATAAAAAARRPRRPRHWPAPPGRNQTQISEYDIICLHSCCDRVLIITHGVSLSWWWQAWRTSGHATDGHWAKKNDLYLATLAQTHGWQLRLSHGYIRPGTARLRRRWCVTGLQTGGWACAHPGHPAPVSFTAQAVALPAHAFTRHVPRLAPFSCLPWNPGEHHQDGARLVKSRGGRRGPRRQASSQSHLIHGIPTKRGKVLHVLKSVLFFLFPIAETSTNSLSCMSPPKRHRGGFPWTVINKMLLLYFSEQFTNQQHTVWKCKSMRAAHLMQLITVLQVPDGPFKHRWWEMSSCFNDFLIYVCLHSYKKKQSWFISGFFFALKDHHFVEGEGGKQINHLSLREVWRRAVFLRSAHSQFRLSTSGIWTDILLYIFRLVPLKIPFQAFIPSIKVYKGVYIWKSYCIESNISETLTRWLRMFYSSKTSKTILEWQNLRFVQQQQYLKLPAGSWGLHWR